MPIWSSCSRASSSSALLSPNFEASPPLSSHLPAPLAASLMRMPRLGRTPSFSAVRAMTDSSGSFSTTRNTRFPIFCASKASSMYDWSLWPLQMMRLSLSIFVAITACNSGFEPASRPRLYFFPWLMISSTTGRIWFTFIG